MISARADVVGSLLRPFELLEAREDLRAGRVSPHDFKVIEDRAVDGAVALQEQAGLEVVTDGEMRRLSFQSQMVEAVDGFGEVDLDAFMWGEWQGDESVGPSTLERPSRLGVVSKLRRKRHLSAEELTYLRGRTSRTAKVTLPSPGLFSNFWPDSGVCDAYPTLESFFADVVGILREEVSELARLGARYIQIDAPHYALLLDPETRAFYEQRGWSLEHWLDRGIELDNAVMDGFPEVTFGFHL